MKHLRNTAFCLKEAMPDVKVPYIEVFLYARVQDNVSTPSDLFVLSYNCFKRSDCFCTTSRVDINGWTLASKIVGLLLIC